MAFDPISLALSKGYTEATAEGMGAVQGKPGPAGKDGITPDIQVGTVTTLSPGQSATVTRQPDSPDSAPVFDFGIPKGEKGEHGTDGADGTDGENGVGVPPGGAVGQILSKKTAADYDTQWIDAPQGGGTTLTAGDGLTITDGVASVDTPIRGIFTQSEYNALPDDKKNKGMYVISDAGGSSGGGGESSDIYSTEETRIGTWIDGKPLYRKVIEFTFPSSGGWHNGPSYGEVGTITRFEGSVNTNNGNLLRLPYLNTSSSYSIGINPDKINGNVIRLDIGSAHANIVANQSAFVIIEYTKPTEIAEVTA